MALQAKQDFPQIDFSKSIMVGNKLSDMQFARNAGIPSVFAATTNPDTPYPHPLIDLRVNSLLEFAQLIKP
jgi:histidinol phosphatase-like enzyme